MRKNVIAGVLTVVALALLVPYIALLYYRPMDALILLCVVFAPVIVYRIFNHIKSNL